MKRITILLLGLMIFTSCKGKDNELKRYKVKSGKITYQSSINGKVLGGTITGKGNSTCHFKDWGAIERREEKETTTTAVKIPFAGIQKDVTSSHTMNKLISGKSYSVDFEAKKIYEMEDMAMNMIKKLHPNQDAEEVGRKGIEAMGGEKIGTEKILGYECEVWETVGVKQWTYKGVTLKTETNTAGIHVVEEATSADFDISVSENDLKLPDFPIEKQEGFLSGVDFEEDEDMMDDMKDEMKKMKKMSFDEWKKEAQKNDAEMQQMSDEQLRQIYNMMQKASKMIQ